MAPRGELSRIPSCAAPLQTGGADALIWRGIEQWNFVIGTFQSFMAQSAAK